MPCLSGFRCHDFFQGTTSSRFWGCSENSPLPGRFRPGPFTDEDQADFAQKQVSHHAQKLETGTGPSRKETQEINVGDIFHYRADDLANVISLGSKLGLKLPKFA